MLTRDGGGDGGTTIRGRAVREIRTGVGSRSEESAVRAELLFGRLRPEREVPAVSGPRQTGPLYIGLPRRRPMVTKMPAVVLLLFYSHFRFLSSPLPCTTILSYSRRDNNVRILPSSAHCVVVVRLLYLSAATHAHDNIIMYTRRHCVGLYFFSLSLSPFFFCSVGHAGVPVYPHMYRCRVVATHEPQRW